MKRIVTYLLVILLALCISVSAQAPEISDQAELLTASEEAALQQKIDGLKNEYHFQAVIVTVDSLHGRSPKSFAEDYYLDHGYGIGENKDGILLLIAMGSRDWYIATHGQTRDVVTDDDIDSIAEEILSDLSVGNYYEAFDAFLDQTEAEYGSQKTAWVRNLLIALAIGAVIAAIALFFMRRAMNTARRQAGAGDYLKAGSFDLYECRDFYLYSRTTKVQKSQNNSSGSRSSSSSSFGGRGGKF